jgi:hypothetical protein
MPISRRVDPTGVLWTTIHGTVTIADLKQHLAAVREMQGQGYREVIDTRDAIAKFSAKDLPRLAQHGRALLAAEPMAPRAIVVRRDDLVSFGVARLFAALAMPWVTVRVFDSVPAALAFVGALVSSGA